MCRRAFCETCSEEMIHRDHRKYYESSSGLGQVVNRDMARSFGTTDLDLVSERTRGGVTLVRAIEQKQSAHHFVGSQSQIMAVLAALIDHARDCKEFTAYRLAPDSGAYVAYGEIVPASGTGGTERQRLWLPERLTVQRLGNDPEETELTRLNFLLWVASTARERETWKRQALMREFLKPSAAEHYLRAEQAELSAYEGRGA
jgi:hypothetical protein